MDCLFSEFTESTGTCVCDIALKSGTHQTSVHEGTVPASCADLLAPRGSHIRMFAPPQAVLEVSWQPGASAQWWPCLLLGEAGDGSAGRGPDHAAGMCWGNPGHCPALSRVVRATGQLRQGSEDPEWPSSKRAAFRSPPREAKSREMASCGYCVLSLGRPKSDILSEEAICRSEKR